MVERKFQRCKSFIFRQQSDRLQVLLSIVYISYIEYSTLVGFYIADLCKGSTTDFDFVRNGSSPLSASKRGDFMRGSKIAREIDEDLKREKVKKEALLRRKRRGDRCEREGYEEGERETESF